MDERDELQSLDEEVVSGRLKNPEALKNVENALSHLAPHARADLT